MCDWSFRPDVSDQCSSVFDHELLLPQLTPPYALEATNSACIGAGLAQSQHSDLLAMYNKCDIVCDVLECDAAKANLSLLRDRYEDYDRSNTKPFDAAQTAKDQGLNPPTGTLVIIIVVLCLLHQVNLILGLLLASVDGPGMYVFCGLFCAANVLRTPGVFVNVLNRVEFILHIKLKARPARQ